MTWKTVPHFKKKFNLQIVQLAPDLRSSDALELHIDYNCDLF